jgi:hypothetical protein
MIAHERMRHPVSGTGDIQSDPLGRAARYCASVGSLRGEDSLSFMAVHRTPP